MAVDIVALVAKIDEGTRVAGFINARREDGSLSLETYTTCMIAHAKTYELTEAEAAAYEEYQERKRRATRAGNWSATGRNQAPGTRGYVHGKK